MVSMALAGKPQEILSAREMGVVACTRCTKAWPLGTATCGRCGQALESRDALSLQRVWAYWLMGAICYIPANILPMLNTRTLFQTHESTIIGGAVELAQDGNLGIAAIILFASVVIPLGKFWAVAFLAVSVRQQQVVSRRFRRVLYEVVEYIGRWSMIDIFVVAILSSLVQLKTLASITPGAASLFFALSVIFTMLAAQAFDSRMIWDVQAKAGGQRDHD